MKKASEIGFLAKYTVRTSEIDINKNIKIPALIQLMQEASMQNAMQLGVSYWELETQNLSWVLLRKEVEIIKLPSLGDEITVFTYPSGFDKLFAYRDFKVFDTEGVLLAQASSTWILLDTNTRKLSKINIDDFKIHTPEDVDFLPRPKSKIKTVTNSSFEKYFEVNYDDLDWNHHVNNVFIIKALLLTVPDEKLIQGGIKKMSFHFKNESLWKDKLRSKFEISDSSLSVHQLVRDSDGMVIANAEVVWFS